MKTDTKLRPVRLYLSGKMAGLPDNGFGYFNSMAASLRGLGYEVVNPAENDEEPTWEAYLKKDLASLLTCDKIAVLNNWKDSRGARLEVYVAQQLKIEVVDVHTLAPLKEPNILEEAAALVGGDRQSAYGHPYDDYSATVAMFNTWMRHKYKCLPGENYPDLSASDGVMFMEFVKLSREGNRTKRDNKVDAAGYLLCLDMVQQREEEEATKKSVQSLKEGLNARSRRTI